MKKYLKTYLPFASNELKRQLSYKGAFYLWILISMFSSFISYFLWMAIYGSSKNGIIGNLTQNEMVVYVFMVYVTSSMVTVSISDWVSEDVVKGNIAMNLIKPIDYRMSLISMAVGNMLYRLMAPGIFVWIGIEIYKVFWLGMELISLDKIVVFLISCSLSFLIFVLFDFCFGMIAFFTTYIFGLMLVKDAILKLLTGQLIPISLFPVVFQKLFSFLPFSSMIYTPVMIYLGKYEGKALLSALGMQLFWVVFLYILGSIIWNQVTKRLVVLGG